MQNVLLCLVAFTVSVSIFTRRTHFVAPPPSLVGSQERFSIGKIGTRLPHQEARCLAQATPEPHSGYDGKLYLPSRSDALGLVLLGARAHPSKGHPVFDGSHESPCTRGRSRSRSRRWVLWLVYKLHSWDVSIPSRMPMETFEQNSSQTRGSRSGVGCCSGQLARRSCGR